MYQRIWPSIRTGSGAIFLARRRPSSPCEHLKRTVRFSRVYIVGALGGARRFVSGVMFLTRGLLHRTTRCFRPLLTLVWAKYRVLPRTSNDDDDDDDDDDGDDGR